ncbi:MAG TPA: hypothetical protein VIL97_03890, partial [Thermoanaerobaculia bacterium]
MNHIPQDELILHYYHEATGADVAGHLAACSECRTEYDVLRRVLGAVDQLEVPEPNETPSRTYEEVVWNRLRWRLGKRSGGRLLRKLAPLGAVAAMLALAFLAGQISNRPATTTPPAGPTQLASTPASRERVFFFVVADHLDRSRRMLLELSNVQNGDRHDISTEQQWAEDLVESNRLYRQTAATEKDPAVNALLEELEPILLEIAHGPTDLSHADLVALQKRIESKGMLLKLRVITTKVREETGAPGAA